MTTDSTEIGALVPPGEPMTDLLEALDELIERTNSSGSDWIPIDRFYGELNRIHAEACRRLGESPMPIRAANLPEPGHSPTEDDIEGAIAYWMLTEMKAENVRRSATSVDEDEFWQEADAEAAEYEAAFVGYRRISCEAFRAALAAKIEAIRSALPGTDCFTAAAAHQVFEPMMADCLSELAACQRLSAGDFAATLQPRVEQCRERLGQPRRRKATELLAEATASFASILTEIEESERYPGSGQMASAAWAIAAFEAALAANVEFRAARFWRIFDSHIELYEADLPQTSRA